MKVISRNTELIILLLIIFYIYFTLTVMYENKITLLKESMTKESDCISEESLYFQANNNNKYVVDVVFEKRIAEGYVQMNYNGISSILEFDPALANNLLVNTKYILTIEKTSESNIIKTDLQDLIKNNRLVSIEQEV
jgi:hypothetical protein